MRAYIAAFVSTDSRNEVAQARMSALRREFVILSQLDTRLAAWIGSLDVESLLADSEVARAHEFALHRLQIASERQMTPG